MLARIRKSTGDEDKGFTLIELLVVVIIIGILAAIAIPVFLNQRQKGYDAQTKSDLRNVATLQETYMTDNGAYATNVTSAAQPAVPAADTIYYKKSPNAGAMTTKFVAADGTLTGATATTGFCLQSLSDSGKTFAYNSSLGGLQAAGSTCP